MIIKKITLKNFYRYGSNEQELDLTGTGITAVTGFNGVGKSSCGIDSLLFALYGKYRCDTIDGVVNRYIGKDCKVGVEFEVDGKEYKVLRYRKHSIHNNNVYIFEGDKDISGHTASETNAKIIDIIKIPYIAFINSSIFSTELYSAFLANKVSDRLVVFENILSLKEITLFYTEAKNILKELNENKNEMQINKTALEREKLTLEQNVNNYTNNAKSKLLEMKKSKDSAKLKIEEYKKQIEELSIVDVNLEKSKLNNNSLKEEYEKTITRLEKESDNLTVKENKEDLFIVNKYKDVNFEENKIKELKYKEDLETIKIRENGMNFSMTNLNSFKSDLSNKKSKKYSNTEKMLEFNKSLEKLNSAICPFCGQHLNSERAEEEKNRITKQLNDLSEENKELDKNIELLETQIKEESENYNWMLGEINRIKETLNKDFYPNTELIQEQYLNALKNVETVNKQKEENSIRILEIATEIEDIRVKLRKLETTNYTEEELNSISTKIENIKNSIADKEKEIATIDGQVSSVYDKNFVNGIKEEISKKEEVLVELNKKFDELNNDIFHYEFLIDCFSNKTGGFKKYFIGEMIDVFNTKINQYLPFFFDEDVNITFDRNLEDTIKMDGFTIDFNSFSQGQRQRAELAISFALFDVARIFFSNDNKLLILDEVDKGLDKIGIKAMINLLNGFDKQLKIFIISHNPLLEDEIENKIKISRDENGFSIIN